MASAKFINAFKDFVATSNTVQSLPVDKAVQGGIATQLANAGLTTSDASKVLTAATGKSGDLIEQGGKLFTRNDAGELIPETTGDKDIVVSGAKNDSVDARLRISALRGKEDDIYGPKGSENILSPLHETGGLMFPYTPAIQISGEATWTPHDLVHTNFDILSYQRTPSVQISLTGKFTVQNQREGAYAAAVIHFLRVITKMHYGDQDSAQDNAQDNSSTSAIAGLPPPVLRLRGYGQYMFNDLRCVIKTFSFNFDENMDLIPIRIADGEMYLPPMFTISIAIGLQNSPAKVKTEFNLNTFRTGALLNTPGGNWF